jgi:hypothetical protein
MTRINGGDIVQGTAEYNGEAYDFQGEVTYICQQEKLVAIHDEPAEEVYWLLWEDIIFLMRNGKVLIGVGG